MPYSCDTPKVRVYKGSRYVPIWADPLEWDKDKNYPELCVVYSCGRTYISKTRVPAGQPLPEYPEMQNKYWALYADYNAQLEHYRAEVKTFSTRYDQFFCHLQKVIEDEIEARKEADRQINIRIDNLKTSFDQFKSWTENKFNEVDNSIQSIQNDLRNIKTDIQNIKNDIKNLKDEISSEIINNIQSSLTELENAIKQLLTKIEGQPTLKDGVITWPSDGGVIPRGNMNVYGGSNKSNWIKTGAEGTNDVWFE